MGMWTWGRGHVDVGTCPHQVLASTLTLSQPGGADYAHPILVSTPSFESNRRTCQALLWVCGRGDVSTPGFGSYLNPISTRGGRLCLPYTGILGWLKFAVAALAFSLGLVFQFFEIATLCHPKCVYCVETAHRTNYIKCL